MQLWFPTVQIKSPTGDWGGFSRRLSERILSDKRQTTFYFVAFFASFFFVVFFFVAFFFFGWFFFPPKFGSQLCWKGSSDSFYSNCTKPKPGVFFGSQKCKSKPHRRLRWLFWFPIRMWFPTVQIKSPTGDWGGFSWRRFNKWNFGFQPYKSKAPQASEVVLPSTQNKWSNFLEFGAKSKKRQTLSKLQTSNNFFTS